MQIQLKMKSYSQRKVYTFVIFIRSLFNNVNISDCVVSNGSVHINNELERIRNKVVVVKSED
jgi:hypothetical protein